MVLSGTHADSRRPDRAGTSKISLVHLSPVSETLVVPLWARSVESRLSDGVLHDPAAERIFARLDYDFAKFRDGSVSQLTACLRAQTVDRWVTTFLEASPRGTIVELGAGLDTRFERLDNGSATWFELDLPDVIALRRRLFRQRRRRQFMAMSVTEPGWIEPVRQATGPLFFVAEGLLMYLQEHEVRTLLSRLADHFPDSQLAFDAFSPVIADNLAWHDTMRHMRSAFTWSIDDITNIERWDRRYRLVDCVDMADFSEHFGRLPFHQQMLIWMLQY